MRSAVVRICHLDFALILTKVCCWLVHGSISRGLALLFMEAMQQVTQDFAQQHQVDQKLDVKNREGYTLLLAMRSWGFEAFANLMR